MTEKNQVSKELTLQEEMTKAYNDYQKILSNHAYFKVSNRAVSEDLVQDTFLKTWDYLASGGKILLMKAFLYHILNNLIIDEYRKRKTSSLDTLLDKGFEPYVNNTDKILEVMDGERVMHLIEELEEPYKQIMYMKYVLELTVAEISSLTGKTKNTIAVQSFRGLEKLKALYHSRQFKNNK